MSNEQTLEWDKEGSGIRQIRAHDELATGETLTGTPVVEVQRRTLGSDPEDWQTEAGITVSGPSIVDAVADDGETVLGVNQAVQFQLDADPQPQPDVMDTPLPGTNYRVVAVCARSLGDDWVGKVPLHIRP